MNGDLGVFLSAVRARLSVSSRPATRVEAEQIKKCVASSSAPACAVPPASADANARRPVGAALMAVAVRALGGARAEVGRRSARALAWPERRSAKTLTTFDLEGAILAAVFGAEAGGTAARSCLEPRQATEGVYAFRMASAC